ncbi:MAG: RrF2 family transcriptional regulator [Phycisphaerae bacterium]
MKLTAAAELAVRGMLVLASRHGQGPTTLATVCAERDLPKEYLTKIFASLSRDGLITPIRGKGGGYVLARDPKAITLLNIIEAVEGPIALNFCQQDPPQCEEDNCPVRPVWTDLQETIREKLDEKSLSDYLS